MMFVRLLPAILGCLVLGAHFSRAGAALPMIFCVAMALLLAIPRPWVARLAQWTLALGTLEWMRTVFVLVRSRQLMNLPWARAAAILGAVTVLTACSLLVFQSPAVRRRFGLDRGGAAPSGPVDAPEV